MNRCQDCIFSVAAKSINRADGRTETPIIECHRYAPRPAIKPGGWYVSFPIVNKDQTCGEWQPRPTPAQTDKNYL